MNNCFRFFIINRSTDSGVMLKYSSTLLIDPALPYIIMHCKIRSLFVPIATHTESVLVCVLGQNNNTLLFLKCRAIYTAKMDEYKQPILYLLGL